MTSQRQQGDSPKLTNLALSTGRYRTIVADPPWQYQKANGMKARTAEAHYSTLVASEIARIPVADIAEDDAHLYLWVTNPVLTEQRTDASALLVARSWGFEPKTVLTWIKGENGAGMGWFFRGDTEHVLFCVRGTLPIPPEKRISNVFRGKRGPHSAKPDAFLDLVERVSPGPYAELFARRARFGWDHPIGDQALGGIAA